MEATTHQGSARKQALSHEAGRVRCDGGPGSHDGSLNKIDSALSGSGRTV